MRRTRAEIAHAARVRAARNAASHLRRLAQSLGCRVAALYAATSDEICTAAAAAELRRAGLAVAFPRILRKERGLAFHRADPTLLRPGALRIPEPSPSLPRIPVENIDLFVVPGLAFDSRGGRVGWGQGYYDRILARSPRAVRVGFAYADQIVNTAPITRHDVPMDYIVSEIGILDCRPHAARSGTR